MKLSDLESKIIKSAPLNSRGNTAFTDQVMNVVTTMSHQGVLHTTDRIGKRSLLFRLHHLPKFAVILLAIVLLFTISGVSYAIVETVKHLNVGVEKSGPNTFGREQLNVTFDSCAEQEKTGTKYELKKDSGLSIDDGAKVLQARCDLDLIGSWIEKDTTTKSIVKDHPFISSLTKVNIGNRIGTVTATDDETITLNDKNVFTLPGDARIINDNTLANRDSLKPGDTVLYFSPYALDRMAFTDPAAGVIVFKLKLPANYYNLRLQSYVSTRGACIANPKRECLLHNSINSVKLILARGGATAGSDFKNIQGRIVEYNAHHIKLAVGDGVYYTIQTPSNIIDGYNTSSVYRLDRVYAKTDPNALKVTIGDTLDVYYNEVVDKASHDLAWAQTLTISLLVERDTKDQEVIRKY